LKKFLIVALSLILVLALAVTANAGVKNTVHDFQSGTALAGFGGVTAQRGMCSYCHIPHSSKGDRLWPTAGADSAARAGIIGVLCASCHVATSNSNNSRSPCGAIDGVNRGADIYNTEKVNHVLVDDGVYSNNTNQNYTTAAPYSGTNQMGQANTWPYCGTQGEVGTAQVIECSSCHNPHSEAYGQSSLTGNEAGGRLGYGNDFLRASFYNTTAGVAFCEYCHEEKTRGGLASNTIGTGTHPVGATANAGDTAQKDIHIESEERAALIASKIVSSVVYDLGIGSGAGTNGLIGDFGPGTHLTLYRTGGVTCQTCHKVHGAPSSDYGTSMIQTEIGTQGSYYAGANKRAMGSSDDGNVNILAVENDANGGTVGYSYPTEGRTAGDYNDLCVDCHETTPSVGKNWATIDGNERRTTADGGATNLDSHPVNIAPDGKSESGFDLTVKDPTWYTTNNNWTDARWAGGNNVRGANGDLFAANGRYNGSGSAPTNSRNEIVCITCHSLHDGEPGTPILRAKSTDYCSDCHSYSIGAVSHPVGNGSAMRDNPDAAVWPNGDNLPLADYYLGTSSLTSAFKHTNGDTTTDMACYTCHAAHDGVDGFMLRVTDDNSRLCTGCHTDIVNLGVGSENENPSNYIAEYAEAATARLGSHYTGTVSSSSNYIGEARWAYSGKWTDSGYYYDATGGEVLTMTRAQTAHWNGNGTYTRMQCQSCHTPHNAAAGLVEANSIDGNATNIDGNGGLITQADDNNTDVNPANGNDVNYDNTSATRMCSTPTSALLLGSNVESKMCATCHWPEGTHVTTIYTVMAKPDPERIKTPPRDKRKYRNYCTRIEDYIIATLIGSEEQAYNVYDLIANDATMDTISTPESPCSFPPLRPGRVPTGTTGKMLCDSCHTPHAAGSGGGAFILDDPSVTGAATFATANQRVVTRNYQELCWDCHDK